MPTVRRMRLTSEHIEYLGALDRAATPGPWYVAPNTESGAWVVEGGPYAAEGEVDIHIEVSANESGNPQADAELIAEARNVLPAALAEIAELRAVLRKCREAFLYVPPAPAVTASSETLAPEPVPVRLVPHPGLLTEIDALLGD